MSWTWCQGENISCDASAVETVFIDPDIAGWGVLAAFIITGLATVCATHFGYITDSLGDASLNQLDAFALAKFRKWLNLKRLPLTPSASEMMAKKVRTEALLKFILALSDQQLVTGLAILVASFALRCTVTGLNFEIASSLAWFSSITHLATLSVLQQYFRTRPWMRGIRIFGMLAVLFLLIASLFVTIVFSNIIIPIQCFFDGVPVNDDFIYSQGILGNMLSNGWVAAWLLLYLAIAYGNRIICLYVSDSTITITGWAIKKFEKRYHLDSKETYQQKVIKAITDSTIPITRRQNITKHIKLSIFFFQELLNSYLWQLIFAYFGFFYGMSQVFWNVFLVSQVSVVEETASTTLPISTGPMAFGQLVPLLLLVFPILAALEVYEDVRVSRRSESQKRKTEDGVIDPSTTSSSSPTSSVHTRDTPQAHERVESLEENSNTTDVPPPFEALSNQNLDNNSSVLDDATSRYSNGPTVSVSSELLEIRGSSNPRQVTEIASTSDATFGLRHATTERSIGIEQLSLDNATYATQPPQTPRAPPTMEQLSEVYKNKYTGPIIVTFVILSYGGFSTFSLLLVGYIPIDSLSPTILTLIWGCWYFSGFSDLALRYVRRRYQSRDQNRLQCREQRIRQNRDSSSGSIPLQETSPNLTS